MTNRVGVAAMLLSRLNRRGVQLDTDGHRVMLVGSGYVSPEERRRVRRRIVQIWFEWTCRECGNDQRAMLDSSNMPADHALRCQLCGHISGVLVLDYRFRPDHAPSWERSQG